MYLNVKLAAPAPTVGEATCNTPKTPEILNSIINLTSPVQSSQYEYQEIICDASSPIDNGNSFEEYSSFGCEEYPLFHGRTLNGEDSPTYNKIAKNLHLTFGMGSSSIGTPSPPGPELPSPIQPVEVTKSALIKEGLKHQIQTKLNAAGISSPVAFSELKDFKEELTLEDEERRRRRRERNKVAATKCRNKKKERTCILVNESEEVEGENYKLKSEIERLKNEKMKLEKLLEDPSHLACCLRSTTNGVSKHIMSSGAAVSLPKVTCTQHVSSVPDGHYAVSKTADYSTTESIGMSYSTLSNPSPTTAPSYLSNHNDKSLFGTSANIQSSKLSSFPIACSDALKSISEAEETDNSFVPLSFLSTTNLSDKLNFSDKPELLSTLNLSTALSSYPQCGVQNNQPNIMQTTNYPSHVLCKSSVDSGRMNDVESSTVYEPKLSESNIICNSEEDCFCATEHRSTWAECSNAKIAALKTTCLPKLPKTASRYSPYERNNVPSTHLTQYSERSLQNDHFSTKFSSQNTSSAYATEYNRQLYSTCTYESI